MPLTPLDGELLTASCVLLPIGADVYSDKHFPDGSDGKESAGNVGDPGLIPGWEDPLGKVMATHSSILGLENPMDRGA